MDTNPTIPVTVLTGFLGAGKTTLLNRILSGSHGLRIAVIENEFGEIGIDHDLVINAEEEIFEMNNGCICCTVRGDLIRILASLMKRSQRFDHILIETTGLADPGPVIQTFFMDPDLKQKFHINGIVTIVDSHHLLAHLDQSHECHEQIAFADLILLNKVDRVDPKTLPALELKIRSINPMAKIYQTVNTEIPIPKVLEIEGFKLDRILELEPNFLTATPPFEWLGVFDLPSKETVLEATHNPDPTLSLAWIPLSEKTSLTEAQAAAEKLFYSSAIDRNSEDALAHPNRHYRLNLHSGHMRFPIHFQGKHALALQHHPSELNLEVRSGNTLLKPLESIEFEADHQHDETVTSVGIESDHPLDYERLSQWISRLLRDQGVDLYRMKGVLSVQGIDERVIFQSVHMLLDCTKGKPWEQSKRTSRIIFIGKNLNRIELNTEFKQCFADT